MGQHYVARFYLKPWAEKGKVYCLNLKHRQILHKGLRGIANEKRFYRLQDLTADERRLIERVAIEPCPEALREVQRNFITLFCLPPQLKKHVESKHVNSKFTSSLDDMIENAAENYHARIENSLKQFIDSMLAGSTGFYSNDRQAAEFLYTICVQFTRTKRAREAALMQIGATFKGCNVERVWSVLSHIIATSVGRSLYADRKAFKLLLVDNSTDTPFITTDQPIINLHATFTGLAPDKLEFFYPLSPRKAMLLVETSNAARADSSPSTVAVNSYNILMVRNSFEQVFSNSADYLETVKKSYIYSFDH